MIELKKNSVELVSESWKTMHKIPDFGNEAGEKLFRKFFELDPTPAVFSFGRDVSELNDRFYASPGLHQHAKNVIRYLDRAIDLLASGDSDNELGGVLLDLGQKHAAFGVTARMYQPMGQALIATVAEILGEDRFTPDVLQAWIEVFEALASEMIRAKDS